MGSLNVGCLDTHDKNLWSRFTSLDFLNHFGCYKSLLFPGIWYQSSIFSLISYLFRFLRLFLRFVCFECVCVFGCMSFVCIFMTCVWVFAWIFSSWIVFVFFWWALSCLMRLFGLSFVLPFFECPFELIGHDLLFLLFDGYIFLFNELEWYLSTF